MDPRLIFFFCRKIYRMPEPLHRPEDSSNVIAMKVDPNEDRPGNSSNVVVVNSGPKTAPTLLS